MATQSPPGQDVGYDAPDMGGHQYGQPVKRFRGYPHRIGVVLALVVLIQCFGIFLKVVSGAIIATPGAPGEVLEEQTLVFGFPVEDDEVRPIVQRVLQLSFAAGILVVAGQVAK